MRVLFTCHGGAPHLYPMVPLAWAFRAAGHEVRIASQTRILPQLEHTGLPVVEISGTPGWTPEEQEETRTAIYTQPPWPPGWARDLWVLTDEQRGYLEFIGRRLIRTAESMIAELAEFAAWWRPDLLVYDAIAFSGLVVATELGIPAIRYLFGVATAPRTELDARGVPLPEYERLFTDRGLPVTLSPAMAVDPTPPSMRMISTSPCLDMRYVPYNGAGSAPEWVREPRDRPRVCVTWGHTAALALGGAAAQPYRAVIDAIAELGVEVLVASTAEQIERLGPLPPGIRTASSVPLQLLLAHCDALVQQGGDGTTLTGAAMGVPQLAITLKPDAEVSPGGLVTTGAGIHLRYQELRDDPASPAIVRDAVEKLLVDPSYPQAAERLRAEIERQPPPAEVVPKLVALGGKGSGDGR
jgi:UDP:flavonoid glycosyltransferase YjiC (YdhE family)